MKRTLRAVGLLLAFVLVTSAPVAAMDSTSFEGNVRGQEVAFVPGPEIPPGRCPAEAGWMLFFEGRGRTDAFGTFTWSSSHCSWPVGPIEGGAEGRLDAGLMTVIFDETGDHLYLEYSGNWYFRGDLDTGQGSAHVWQGIDIVGGSGMFEGATGGGSMNGIYSSGRVNFLLDGALELGD